MKLANTTPLPAWRPGDEFEAARKDQMALGAMEALDARGLRGKVLVVGFDATREAVRATVEGRLTGTVAQNPRAMGQRGVEAALAAIEGRPVEPRIDTGTEMVTGENAEKYLKVAGRQRGILQPSWWRSW